MVWWFMPLRGKVPRDSWCGFVRIKWEARRRWGRDGCGGSDVLPLLGAVPLGQVYLLTSKLPCP